MRSASAIRLELRLTGPARADAAAEPRERRAGAGQARQQIFELRELHLPLALARARAAGEDVENQLRAIDHLALDPLLELPLLGWGQLVVEDHHVHGRLVGRGGQRGHLARADERRGIGLRPFLQHPQDDSRSRGVRKAGKLVERMIRVGAGGRGDQAYECGAFECRSHNPQLSGAFLCLRRRHG